MIPHASRSVKGSKSQSALEYMMTYGWAILIIVIVAGVLYSLGIFSPSSSIGTTVTGFNGLGSPTALCMANGGLRLQLGNDIGTTINVTGINVTANSVTQTVRPNKTISTQGTYIFYVPNVCSGGSGARYSFTSTVAYTEPGQTFAGPYFSNGAASGVISSTNLPGQVLLANNPNYGDIPNSVAIDSAKSTLTVTFWAKSLQPPHDFQSIINKGWVATPRQWYFIASNGGFIYGLSNNSASNGGYEVSHYSLGTNWTFFVGTFTSGAQDLYMDANLWDTFGLTGEIAPNTQPIWIAAYFGGGNAFNGTLSNIQIYNSTLDQTQISQLYSEGLGGSPLAGSQLIGWWPLNNTFKDFSGEGNNMVNDGMTFTTNYVYP